MSVISLVTAKQQVEIFARASYLSNLMPGLVSVEYSAVTDI